MTSRDMYVLGWVTGRIVFQKPDIKVKFESYCSRPISGLAQILATARREHVLDDDLNQEIGMALCEITDVDDQIQSGETEKVQPLELQGSWQLGYYAGKSGRPLPEPYFDIAKARNAKGMTQQQLADLMGVDQPLVSRWEQHLVKPNEKNMERLKELLA